MHDRDVMKVIMISIDYIHIYLHDIGYCILYKLVHVVIC